MPEIDRLEIAIQSEATRASAELDKVIKKLNILSGALGSINTGSFKNMASGINVFAESVKNVSNLKPSDFNRLSKNIDKIANINQVGIQATAGSLKELTNVFDGIGSVSDEAVKLSEIAKNVGKLGGVNIQRAAENLPKLSIALKEFMETLATAPNVSSNIINMTNAMANLASQGSKYGSAMKGISRASNSVANATNIHTKAMSDSMHVTSSFINGISKLTFAYFMLRQAVEAVFTPIKSSMDFVETINLFQTSFKKIGMDAAQKSGLAWGSAAADQYAIGFINKAQAFNDRISQALSLDPNTTMNYQAVFAQISHAMGLTSEVALNMSESFTLLGNDIASLWNLDTKTAMEKLQSGLAGQVKPLRELGIDITQASLQLTAYKYGIMDSVSKMSQAAKTQLRWLTIMDQSEVAFGDMAKTIDSPSNQLRILEQQWNNLTRSIGNVFLPIVSAVLPYINALVIALRRMIDTLATAMGYELPDYTDTNIYKDVTGDIIDSNDDMANSASGAAAANNKLKKSLLGIDELNILTEKSTKGSSGAGGGSGYPGLDDAIGNKTDSYMAKFNEELANMKNKAEELADIIQPKIEGFIKFLGDIAPALAGIAAAFVTYKIIGWFTDLAKWIGALTMSPAGVIAIAVGALAFLVLSLSKYYDNLVDKDLAKRFGDITLSLEDIEDIASKLTTNKYTAKIDVYITEKAKLKDLEKNIKTDLDTLNKLNWKISVGLGLTPAEKETYKSTIESFIDNTEAYIQQQRYVVDLAIDAVVQDDGKFNTEMKALVDEYFKGSEGEMERLGKQLREKMDNALADGIIDATEQKTINNLIKEMNEITSQVSSAEFKAKLQMITVDGQLTADSFKDLTKEIQSAIDGKVGSEQEAYYTALTYINVAYQAKIDKTSDKQEKAKLQKQWDTDVKELGENFSKTKATITLEGMTFSLDTLTKNYKKELDKSSSKFVSSTKEVIDPALASALKDMDTDSAMGQLAFAMTQSYQDALSKSGLSSAGKTGLKQMLKSLEPSKEQLEKIYQDALNAGTQVPDGVSDALTDIANLGALTGDMDSIAFLIGQKLSTDQTYLDLLGKSKDAGTKLNDYLIMGLKSKIPDLQLQGEALVHNVDTGVSAGVKNSTVNASAQNQIAQFNKAYTNDKTTISAITEWLKTASTTISNFKLPDLKVAVQLDTSALNNVTMFGKGVSTVVSKYASGGFPSSGEMYVARENGINEMVGRIGRKSAVVNNDQIVQSVSGGVANAIVDVMAPMMMAMGGSSNSGGDVVVENYWYTSDEKLYQSTQRGKMKSERRYQTVNQF